MLYNPMYRHQTIAMLNNILCLKGTSFITSKYYKYLTYVVGKLTVTSFNMIF